MKKTMKAFLAGFAAAFISVAVAFWCLNKLGIPIYDFHFLYLELSLSFFFLTFGGYLATKMAPQNAPLAAIGIGIIFAGFAYLESRDATLAPGISAMAMTILAFGPILGWIGFRAKQKTKKTKLLFPFILMLTVGLALASHQIFAGLIDKTTSYNLGVTSGYGLAELDRMFGCCPIKSESSVSGCMEYWYWKGMIILTVINENNEIFELNVNKPFKGRVYDVKLEANVRKTSDDLSKKGLFHFEEMSVAGHKRFAIFRGNGPYSLHLMIDRHEFIKGLSVFNERYTIKYRPRLPKQ